MKLDYFGQELAVNDYVVLRSPGSSSSHRLILGRIARFTDKFVTVSHPPVKVWGRGIQEVKDTNISSKHCIRVPNEQAMVKLLSD
jgi:hypothetical protein